jgi:hypothetical protein
MASGGFDVGSDAYEAAKAQLKLPAAEAEADLS